MTIQEERGALLKVLRSMMHSEIKPALKQHNSLARLARSSSRVYDFPDRSPVKIALIGGFAPRRCGIATFTTDIYESMIATFPSSSVDVYAMRSAGREPYDDAAIAGVIDQDEPEDYVAAARQIEASCADIVWLQHEFGLFGGAAGAHILRLVEMVAAPLFVTLHTVLDNPDADQRAVMDRLVARASRLMVMSEVGRERLLRVYGADAQQIVLIPHGVPDRPFGRTETYKAKAELSGRRTLMTFGLISPGKGIETVIAALPAIAHAHPDTLYCIVGATHPNLIAHEGEAYRDRLKAQIEALGVSDHVRWFDAFFDKEELLDLIEAADIYVTPYPGAAQSTSGTLSYAVALGKAVVSTPYVHASELLSDDHGILVPFNNSEAIAAAVGGLLDDPQRLATMQQRAYLRGRSMVWANFAARAMESILEMRVPAQRQLSGRLRMQSPQPASFGGIVRLTDDTGMLQHSCYSIPDRAHGYCIDDNARALMLMAQIQPHTEMADRLATIYASFVQDAWNHDAQNFRNFMGFARNWLEDVGSEDSNGRTLWALAATARHAANPHLATWARWMFDRTYSIADDFRSPRTLAFAALAADHILAVEPNNEHALRLAKRACATLLALLDAERRPDWSWFEIVLAYDNCRLPEALLRIGKRLGDAAMIACGMETLDWLIAQQTGPSGMFRPVGSDSFGRERTAALPFDQQPVEAWAAIDAGDAAYEASRDARWIDHAARAYQWFLGGNDRGIAVADVLTGASRDGITARGVNENQGAESTLAFHFANIGFRALLAKAEPVVLFGDTAVA